MLLSCMAFLENVLLADDTFAKSLVDFVPKITKVHKTILMEQSAEY